MIICAVVGGGKFWFIGKEWLGLMIYYSYSSEIESDYENNNKS